MRTFKAFELRAELSRRASSGASRPRAGQGSAQPRVSPQLKGPALALNTDMQRPQTTNAGRIEFSGGQVVSEALHGRLSSPALFGP
eukprot:55495-Prorocentrum_minimum.AAC.1